MERHSIPELHPGLLPAGTVVGRWRLVTWAGRGVYGAVYRAVPLGQEQAPAVALKLALHPADPRFVREVELLSRMSHPSIPRLWDSGAWQTPSGTPHPFLAMDWVDGAPLYDQALYPRWSPQVVGMLAQLARALQELHAAGAVHRDVKGGNILVRYADGRALLTDFGACYYPGAATLTPPGRHPGTPAYRSPESWFLELNREPSVHHRAQPADDLFALGVTMCRLLTGEYPELGEPRRDERGLWRVDSVIPPPALLSDARIQPWLRGLTLRLLSMRPEERGTAEQLAEALEQNAAPGIDDTRAPRAIPANNPSRRPEEPAASASVTFASARSWQPWLVLAATVLTMAMGAWWIEANQTEETPPLAQAERVASDRSDAGTAGLGDAAASTSPSDSARFPAPKGMAEETLPAPLPEQTRPDSKGRCPNKKQVAINGGCWVEMSLDREICEAVTLSGYVGRMFKNKCYMPVLKPGRQPNSSPTDTP
ncbi:serine/threonine-protein kinase [Hyalangium versicolor]|uniref:serine/threonine-protein kinase n=1 Tax=Hyalangium versicolor TaxID=2861190 RepID=UPI001CC9D204|nr:serine/threonine-protein kinase [Hyalangium versicolor]